tara:strand:+ start:1077 stop:1718 length:642 start_codon:yes stop_codon:yes gene_type:complete
VSSFQPLTKEELARASTAPTSEFRAKPIAGTEKKKDPFTEGQKKAAGFAVRMDAAVAQMEALEDSGFNPVNAYDVTIENMPFVGDLVENIFKSAKYQVYNRAVNDFLTAQLRKESGAQINPSEFDLMFKTYLPLPGDKAPVLQAKREARRAALAAMIGDAGEAYKRTADIVAADAGDAAPSRPSSEQALRILIERAKNNPELRAELEQRGLIP